jgi:hypothetical protein
VRVRLKVGVRLRLRVRVGVRGEEKSVCRSDGGGRLWWR